MRYLIQFVIPAAIFLGVVYAVSRRRRHQAHGGNDDTASTFLAILVVGAVVAVASLFVLQANWNGM